MCKNNADEVNTFQMRLCSRTTPASAQGVAFSKSPLQRVLVTLAAISLPIAGCPTIVNARVCPRPAPNNPPEIALQIERIFAALREDVFHAWIDAAAIKKWFVYNAPVHWVIDLRANATAGGSFRRSVASDTGNDAFRFHGVCRDGSCSF
jgi:hypothetical protein